MVTHLDLDHKKRLALAERVLTALSAAVTGSTALLRGSLAEGNADPYSDIDVLWEIPDALFQDAVARIEVTLASVQPVESLRSDPDFQNSAKHRLLFVQFAGIPLFWRLDIEVFALSIHRDPGYDLHNEAARGEDWSATHSALMNAIAAMKALLRGQEDNTRQLLLRGYERVRLKAPPGSPSELILSLCENIARMDPAKRELAQRIVELHQQVFG